MIIKSAKNLLPLRIFGGIFLCFGLVALLMEEPFSIGRAVTIFVVSYLLWGLSISTEVASDRIIKRRGWLFPRFSSRYQQLKRIELKSSYIYQHGHGAHSHHALYIGIIDGPANTFVNLSWGVKDTEQASAYLEFVQQLQDLTGLPVNVEESFKLPFKEKFGIDYPEANKCDDISDVHSPLA